MLREIKRKRVEAIEAIKALNKKEKLTEAEDKQLEARWTEAKALEKRIASIEEIERQELAKQPIVPSKKETRQYSLLKAIECARRSQYIGYEGEVAQEIEKRGSTPSAGGFMVPVSELFPRKTEKRLVDNQPALISDGVREDLRLTALYEKSIAGVLGIKQINATGNFRFPTGSKVTAGFITGDGGSSADDKLSEQDTSFTSQSVSPKFLGAYTSWSLKLLKESAGSVSLEAILRENLLAGLAEELDDAIINANGTAPNPQGFNAWLGTTNLKAKTQSSSSKWAWGDFTERKKVLRDNFKNNSMMPKWLMGSLDEQLLREVQRFASSDGQSIFESIGPAVVSGHCPATRMWLGDFSQFMLTIFDSAEVSLGLINDMFLKGSQALRVIMCLDLTGLRKEAFVGFNITRG